MSHALLSPSAAGRWVRCPGSVSLCQQYPEVGRSESEEEGTASHWVSSEVLTRGGHTIQYVGQTAPNGVIISDEMADGAAVYIGAVGATGHQAQLIVEQPLRVPVVHPTECYGTPDLRYMVGSELHVWDYKFGWGIVDPEQNYQLITYALGMLEEVAAYYRQPVGLIDQQFTVVLHIVQPRPYHIDGPHRSWRVPASDLRGYANELRNAAERVVTQGAGAPTCPGEHCKYCSGRHACQALQRSTLLHMDYIATAQPQELSPEALALELRTLQRAASLVDFRLKALETRARMVIESGGMVPGFGIEPGNGRRVWNRPAGEIFALGDLMGINLRAEPSAITPTEARKKLPAELVDAYSEINATGMKLVPTDKTTAARVFGLKGGA